MRDVSHMLDLNIKTGSARIFSSISFSMSQILTQFKEVNSKNSAHLRVRNFFVLTICIRVVIFIEMFVVTLALML